MPGGTRCTGVGGSLNKLNVWPPYCTPKINIILNVDCNWGDKVCTQNKKWPRENKHWKSEIKKINHYFSDLCANKFENKEQFFMKIQIIKTDPNRDRELKQVDFYRRNRVIKELSQKEVQA